MAEIGDGISATPVPCGIFRLLPNDSLDKRPGLCANKGTPTTFIYALTDPRPGDTHVYVGKADNPALRLIEHRRKVDYEHTYKSHWFRQLLDLGLEPVLEVLQEVPLDEWEQWERTYIHWYRVLGWKVLNATDGGDGGAQEWKPESRAKLSASLKAAYTPEWRAAVSHQFKGKPKSAEQRAKMSTSGGKHLKGKTQSPEHIAKCRAAKLGKKFTPEHRAKISMARKGIQFSAETKAKMRAAKAGKPLSPAHVAALRLARERKKRLTSPLLSALVEASPLTASSPTS